MELQYRATSQFTFFCVAMLGRIEALDNNLPQVKNRDIPLLRLLTPILKVWSAKNAFAMSQEAMEAFGGQGYMEETGLGRAMRDVLVNTIWEGTSNVLSLDVLRVMAETGGEALEQYTNVCYLCTRFIHMYHVCRVIRFLGYFLIPSLLQIIDHSGDLGSFEETSPVDQIGQCS